MRYNQMQHKKGGLMEAQHFIDGLIAIVLALVTGFAKHAHTKIEKTAEDLALHKTHIAENYVRNDQLEKIEKTMTHISTRIDAIYERSKG